MLAGAGAGALPGPRRGAAWARTVRRLVVLGWSAWCGLAAAAGIQLREVEVGRVDEAVVLGFQAEFVLTKPVEDALVRGVPLHFVAEAITYRPRWYWRDERIARATRSWRLSYQPLTRRYRVTFGSLNQNYESLSEALGALRSVSRWRIADIAQFEPGERYYIEVRYRLDTSQLPRPLQIGIEGQADWDLSAESTVIVQDLQ